MCRQTHAMGLVPLLQHTGILATEVSLVVQPPTGWERLKCSSCTFLKAAHTHTHTFFVTYHLSWSHFHTPLTARHCLSCFSPPSLWASVSSPDICKVGNDFNAGYSKHKDPLKINKDSWVSATSVLRSALIGVLSQRGAQSRRAGHL